MEPNGVFLCHGDTFVQISVKELEICISERKLSMGSKWSQTILGATDGILQRFSIVVLMILFVR